MCNETKRAGHKSTLCRSDGASEATCQDFSSCMHVILHKMGSSTMSNTAELHYDQVTLTQV